MFHPLKQFRTFLDFTPDPPSARIPAILERFGLRRLVHYKSRRSFLGEYATKVLLKGIHSPHPGIKIGRKCQQIPPHARACPRGRHPVMVADRDTCIIVGSLFETTSKIPVSWTSQDSENDLLLELIQEQSSIDSRSRELQPRTKLLRQFHQFPNISNICALLPSPLNRMERKGLLPPLFNVSLVQKRPTCIILVLLLIALNKKWRETVIHLATVNSMCQEDWKRR